MRIPLKEELIDTSVLLRQMRSDSRVRKVRNSYICRQVCTWCFVGRIYFNRENTGSIEKRPPYSARYSGMMMWQRFISRSQLHHWGMKCPYYITQG